MREFEQIYREQVDHVFRYAFSCIGRREIAEELASDVFLALYRNFAGVDREWVRAWLFRVVKNMAADYWRRRSVEQRFIEQAVPDEAAAGTEDAKSILDSEELKPSHRACLILRYVHGMNREEIAGMTGMTLNQVKSCLQYGLQLLRTQFKGGS